MTIGRIDDLVSWARSRIAHCREQERKFGAGDISIEAATERRTLQAVLSILGVEDAVRPVAEWKEPNHG